MLSPKDFTSFREGAQRFQKAMAGIPDRVPVCAQMHEFAMQEIGATARDFYTNPEILVAGTLEIQEKYGIDVPVLDLRGIGAVVNKGPQDCFADGCRRQGVLCKIDVLLVLPCQHVGAAAGLENVCICIGFGGQDFE